MTGQVTELADEMSFWNRRKKIPGQVPAPADTGQVKKAKKSAKRAPPVAMEVKILAIDALEAGLSAAGVGAGRRGVRLVPGTTVGPS